MPEPKAGGFQKTQYDFAAHLRHPDHNPAPAGIEDRRLKIYRDLIYNNIESFLASGFPVLRRLIDDRRWHVIVRDFVSRHRSHTPYFLEISQEFLRYLQEEFEPSEGDPAFMLELAHYEWVELALDVSSETIPGEHRPDLDVMAEPLSVSPLAWRLSYQYPVHHIGTEYRPEAPGEQPTFLVVYRDRGDEVHFLEVNALTIRLLQILEGGCDSGEQALAALARELPNMDESALKEHGRALLEKLHRLHIVLPAEKLT